MNRSLLAAAALLASASALDDETITLNSGVAPVTVLAGPADTPFAASFVAADFTAASSGPAATVDLTPAGAWIAALPADAAAEWIGASADPGTAGPSGLYAFPFTITETAIGSVTLTVAFAADDALGHAAAPNQGVFVNGTPLAGTTGGGFAAQTTYGPTDITGLVSTGANTVYLYAPDVAGGPSGLIANVVVAVETADADLTLVKTASAPTVQTNAAFSYSLVVSNAGPDAATNVTVTDTLPGGVGYVSASGSGWSCGHAAGIVTCTRASIASMSAAPTITINVTAPGSPTNTINNASASSDSDDPDGAMDSATVNVVDPPPVDEEPQHVPTLNVFGIAGLIALIGLVGGLRRRRG